eukprot:scaffold4482_cov393-Prasinococcus_capsulatus_cf.AAC.13
MAGGAPQGLAIRGPGVGEGMGLRAAAVGGERDGARGRDSRHESSQAASRRLEHVALAPEADGGRLHYVAPGT